MSLPKEQQTAYQRWELASFDNAPIAPQQQCEQDDEEFLARQAEQHARQLAIELEAARERGYQEGLNKGYAEGLAKGRDQAEGERQTLQQIAAQFGEEVASANELIAADVMALALDVAKAMLKTALPAKPELILPVVKEAISYLPTVQQPALLVLNPVDASLVKGQMNIELSAAGWRIVEDAHMERGGCRVETASNQIDATPSTRWRRIADALSSDTSWIDA